MGPMYIRSAVITDLTEPELDYLCRYLTRGDGGAMSPNARNKWDDQKPMPIAIAYVSNKPIGWALVTRFRPTPKMIMVYVAKPYRLLGIGRMLVAELKARIAVKLEHGNCDAMDFYRKVGIPFADTGHY